VPGTVAATADGQRTAAASAAWACTAGRLERKARVCWRWVGPFGSRLAESDCCGSVRLWQPSSCGWSGSQFPAGASPPRRLLGRCPRQLRPPPTLRRPRPACPRPPPEVKARLAARPHRLGRPGRSAARWVTRPDGLRPRGRRSQGRTGRPSGWFRSFGARGSRRTGRRGPPFRLVRPFRCSSLRPARPLPLTPGKRRPNSGWHPARPDASCSWSTPCPPAACWTT